MMHITEDTPPDMLVGAMDLTVHLPNGRSVKMSVERSTPMMDLLVQITTAQHMQLSGYIIQALGMAPSAEHSDRVLPYKPNTPIGALDTQHVKVIPKGRTLPVPKNIPPGHQPFESTFRLKVHLPRNQLYVCRVSRNVRLEEIMAKVCEEKNLDPVKYEFRHPGNLDEVLDPKLSLNDYQITEVYVVTRGTVSLTQTFSSSDIMALRKEEERKQMAAKTGGGVFNLIFKRGKSNNGSGSLSSENRSISPTHSDDSRSVTPPAIQPPIVRPVRETPASKPKPPQRKRRPAPKPPQTSENRLSTDKPPSQISNVSEASTIDSQTKKGENGLTICHSRNSSDSSGYHEASILSDNCTLPRKPKPLVLNEAESKSGVERSQSVSNLSNMQSQSKSTSSLSHAGRKKKPAPPPPPVLKSASSSVISDEKPSPLVASPSVENGPQVVAPVEHTKIEVAVVEHKAVEEIQSVLQPAPVVEEAETKLVDNVAASPRSNLTLDPPRPAPRALKAPPRPKPRSTSIAKDSSLSQETSLDWQEMKSSTDKETDDAVKYDSMIDEIFQENLSSEFGSQSPESTDQEDISKVTDKEVENHRCDAIQSDGDRKLPEVVGVILKKSPSKSSLQEKTKLDSYSRKRGLQIWNSMTGDATDDDRYSFHSTDSESINKKSSSEEPESLPVTVDDVSIDDFDMELFSGTFPTNSRASKKVLQQLQGIHSLEENFPSNTSATSLRSIDSLPGFLNTGSMKKWANQQDLDDISLISDNVSTENKWLLGDTTDTEESLSMAITHQSPAESIQSIQPPSYTPSPPPSSGRSSFSSLSQHRHEHIKLSENGDRVKESCIAQQENIESTKLESAEKPNQEEKSQEEEINEIDWQYQLPSPPTAFRDASPANMAEDSVAECHVTDSVVTSPELFEKLHQVSSQIDNETANSETTSSINDDDKKICSKLTLEHLEKRKSLVYNRELATSLKMPDEQENSTIKKNEVISELENAIQGNKTSTLSRHNSRASTENKQPVPELPNFVITTYDKPKQKINIFEDDTIRSNVDSTHKVNGIKESSSKRNGVVEYDGVFKKPQEMPVRRGSGVSSYFSKPQNNVNFVSRSGSFSTDFSSSLWKPSNPVKRSKSQLTLTRAGSEQSLEDGSMSRSNSLFDVSGLQSLGVLRMIQTKLNTPTNSVEDITKKTEEEKPQPKPQPSVVDIPPSVVKPQPYRPPSINLSTWSERPKTQVSVKEDSDYRIKNATEPSKVVINTSPSKNNEVIRVRTQTQSNNVSIKVNGSEPILSQKSGNVIIKIGTNVQTTETTYRRPLANMNGVEQKSRPHSIAVDPTSDVSRVPIVRSVELKKPFKDAQLNKSITQIYNTNGNDNFRINNVNNNISEIRNVHDNFSNYRQSSEVVNGFQTNKKLANGIEAKPVSRVNSFGINSAPTVRGFRTSESGFNVNPQRKTWNVPSKPNFEKDVTQQNGFISESSLKPVESNRSNANNNPFGNVVLRSTSQNNRPISYRHSMGPFPSVETEKSQPPPPPSMPKITSVVRKPRQREPDIDPRDQLLSAIRNFGGKKGLKAVKV